MPSTAERAVTMQKAGKFDDAALLWRQAVVEGYDKEEGLGRLAECQFRAGKLEAALATCKELESWVEGTSWSPFVRGLVLKQQKKSAEARKQFGVAAMAGHPDAEAQMRRLQ